MTDKAPSKTEKPENPTVDEHLKASDEPAWKHAAAAAMHGWKEHAHHSAKAMRMSAEDYGKALAAACKPPTKDARPHGPALSQYAASKVTQKVRDAAAEKAAKKRAEYEGREKEQLEAAEKAAKAQADKDEQAAKAAKAADAKALKENK